MSKAFTKEGDGREAEQVASRRAPLPGDTPNYVTARGLALLRAELAALEAERSAPELQGDRGRAARLKLGARISELCARIACAVQLAPPAQGSDQVLFGARVRVRVRGEDGADRVYQIVGVDEADPRQGRIAFIAPLARALLGKHVGDGVPFRSPSGTEELEILHVDYDPAAP